MVKNAVGFLQGLYGLWWGDRVGKKERDIQVKIHHEALQEIVSRAANNDWLEYPEGFRLHYFRFPAQYRLQARDGINVFFLDKGPSSMWRQPRLSGPDERDVIRSKVRKFIKKGYIVSPPRGGVKSLIMYFAVPKGVLDGVVQDWRVVLHAGANRLNDSV